MDGTASFWQGLGLRARSGSNNKHDSLLCLACSKVQQRMHRRRLGDDGFKRLQNLYKSQPAVFNKHEWKVGCALHLHQSLGHPQPWQSQLCCTQLL